MLTNRTLARTNNRPREVGRPPLLALGGGTLVLAALWHVLGVLPPLAVFAVAGALLTLLLYAKQKAKTTIPLPYKGNLDEQKSARFSEVQESLEALASSDGAWLMAGSGRLRKTSELPRGL